MKNKMGEKEGQVDLLGILLEGNITVRSLSYNPSNAHLNSYVCSTLIASS